MKKVFLKSQVPYFRLVVASLVINLGLIITVLTIRGTVLPPEVPLFYGLPQGEEQLASSLALILPATVSICLILINIFLSNFFKEGFLKKSLIISGVFSVLFPLATTAKIVFLVGSF